jgi:hypothetical protein
MHINAMHAFHFHHTPCFRSRVRSCLCGALVAALALLFFPLCSCISSLFLLLIYHCFIYFCAHVFGSYAFTIFVLVSGALIGIDFVPLLYSW